MQSVSFAKRIFHSAEKVLRGGHGVLPVPGAAFLKEEAVGFPCCLPEETGFEAPGCAGTKGRFLS